MGGRGIYQEGTPMIHHRTPPIKIIIKYMGEYLCMSFIIRTFILSVVKSETCSGGTSFAEGRLQLALIYYYRSPQLFVRDILVHVKSYLYIYHYEFY